MLAVIGAVMGISLTIVVCLQFPMAAGDVPIIVAPIGASAVLVLAVPSSPLAQPWSVVGGNILSTLVGVGIARVDEARAAASFHLEDIDRALADMHESFDISREDLNLLLSQAELHAMARRGAETP